MYVTVQLVSTSQPKSTTEQMHVISNQKSSPLSPNIPCEMVYTVLEQPYTNIFVLSIHVADPPRVTIHPQDIRNIAHGKSVKLSIQSTGTGPLHYKWEWIPTGEEGGAKQWQPCHAKLGKGPTLTISKVDESNEGSYRCVVNNDAGSDVSNPATLTICKSPKSVI